MFQVRALEPGIALIRVDTPQGGSLTLCDDSLTVVQAARAVVIADEATAHGASVVLVRQDEVLARTA